MLQREVMHGLLRSAVNRHMPTLMQLVGDAANKVKWFDLNYGTAAIYPKYATEPEIDPDAGTHTWHFTLHAPALRRLRQLRHQYGEVSVGFICGRRDAHTQYEDMRVIVVGWQELECLLKWHTTQPQRLTVTRCLHRQPADGIERLDVRSEHSASVFGIAETALEQWLRRFAKRSQRRSA